MDLLKKFKTSKKGDLILAPKLNYQTWEIGILILVYTGVNIAMTIGLGSCCGSTFAIF